MSNYSIYEYRAVQQQQTILNTCTGTVSRQSSFVQYSVCKYNREYKIACIIPSCFQRDSSNSSRMATRAPADQRSGPASTAGPARWQHIDPEPSCDISSLIREGASQPASAPSSVASSVPEASPHFTSASPPLLEDQGNCCGHAKFPVVHSENFNYLQVHTRYAWRNC